MPRPTLSPDTLQVLLYTYLVQGAERINRPIELQEWASASVYNKSLLDDIESDTYLRSKLMAAYFSDPAQFWNIVISYRAALHPYMPPRRGNFWQRLVYPVTHLFGSHNKLKKKPRANRGFYESLP